MEQKQQEIKIRASNDDLKGVYSNAMRITHTQEEFMLDFFSISAPTGVLSARVILSPGHLKRMIQALEDNIKKYEATFGSVTPAETPKEGIGFKQE